MNIILAFFYEKLVDKNTKQINIKFFGNSPFRGNALEGAIRRIFKMAFYNLFYFRLGYIGLGDCPTGF